MIGIAVALIFCVAIPVAIMAMLEPSLHKSAPKTANFRGVMVYSGLGIVWFVWLISFWISAQLLAVLNIEIPTWIQYLKPLFAVLAGSCAFGLFDDWAGSKNTRGFSGHLKALARGQITTGGLKFIGIGSLSLFLAISLFYGGADPIVSSAAGSAVDSTVGSTADTIAASTAVTAAGSTAISILKVMLVTCIVALSANLMNLFDLRPGRAGKMYLLGLLVALISIVTGELMQELGWLNLLALALAALGPLLAVWRFDLGERGMLGDAGANSMGVFLGFLCATSMPIWALCIAAAVLAAVNLLSEKVSFSKIIAGSKLLTTLDELGRTKDKLEAQEKHSWTETQKTHSWTETQEKHSWTETQKTHSQTGRTQDTQLVMMEKIENQEEGE